MRVPIHKLHSAAAASEIIVCAFASNLLFIDAKTGNVTVAPDSTPITAPIRDVHANKTHLVVVSDDKLISYWELATGKLNSTAIKRVNAVKFSPDGLRIIMGDKAGDVYALEIIDFEKANFKLLLGHISMILDLSFSRDVAGSYVITTERDEKIRVSKFPAAYSIESFCLGHKEYVSRFHIPEFASSMGLSGGGDTFLLLWEYATGRKLDRYDLPAISSDEMSLTDSKYSTVLEIKSCNLSSTIAVVLEKRPLIILLGLEGEKVVLKQQINVTRDVLSVCFDSLGNLWIANGPTLLTSSSQISLDSTNLLDISRYDKVTATYLPINNGDALVSAVNARGTAAVDSIDLLQDYYEISKLGKAVIATKYERKNEKFRAKKQKIEQ